MPDTTTRIDATDTLTDACVKIAESNPGALAALAHLTTYSQAVDPQSAFAEFGPVVSLDTYGIYGARIWEFYKVVCGDHALKPTDPPIKTLAVLRACQLGIVSQSQLNHAIDNRGDGLDVDAVVEAVKAQLANFARKQPCDP